MPEPGEPHARQLHADEQPDQPVSGLLNSGLFTGGVLLCTIVFGVLVGYALAHARVAWPRRRPSRSCCWCRSIPFQLLQIPLYVLVARDYGLADNVLGMILPFAINSTAVIVFRQYFLQVPRELFEAGTDRRRARDPAPLERRDPARASRDGHGAAADVHRAVERVPVAVPDHEAGGPAAARRLPRQLHQRGRVVDLQPVRRRHGGSRSCSPCPSSSLFIVFQRYFVSSDLGSGVKG